MALCLHAFCSDPPAVILDYTEVRNDVFCWDHSTAGSFLWRVMGVAESLRRVYQKVFVHNITVSDPPCCRSVHIVDFGLASRIGKSLYFELFGMSRDLQEEKLALFRSRELKMGLPLQTSKGVFIVGMLKALCQYLLNF